MKQIILGTAGHIDHGKTSLIKALTGTDTDRLKEEKLRGITIELGFAELDLPGGQHVGIVDVPGHEKFVKNMVAGATGIDIVAMVIAADEGVMPQTKEHFEICNLLNIQHGFVVLTKTDMVDEEWLELVQEDIREYLTGTFLEDADILPVSSTTGAGIPEFTAYLDDYCKKIPERKTSSLFRLPVDRVFTMKGFGTVITGTLASGKVHLGDTISVYPSEIESKVRGIQVHGKSVETAETGMRTAINFQGLDLESVNRGNVISVPDLLKPSHLVDGYFQYLEGNTKPLKSISKVRFHTGTDETMGNLVLLDRDELLPGESAAVQIRLETPVTTVKDDKFVIRSYSPVQTIGGGEILNPMPRKHKRFRDDVINYLDNLRKNDPDTTISLFVDQGGYFGISFTNLKIMSNSSDKNLKKNLQALLAKRTVILVDKEHRIYIHENAFERLTESSKLSLEEYHTNNPLKESMPREEFRSKLPDSVSSRLFNLVVSQMVKNKTIETGDNSVKLAIHKVALQFDQEDIKNKMLKIYQTSDLTPPFFKTVIQDLEIEKKPAMDVLSLLIKEKKIIKVKEDLYYYFDTLDKLKDKLKDFLTENTEITTPEFKNMTGISRKFVIALIEYFDSINFTIRVGDTRQLRGR